MNGKAQKLDKITFLNMYFYYKALQLIKYIISNK